MEMRIYKVNEYKRDNEVDNWWDGTIYHIFEDEYGFRECKISRGNGKNIGHIYIHVIAPTEEACKRELYAQLSDGAVENHCYADYEDYTPVYMRWHRLIGIFKELLF